MRLSAINSAVQFIKSPVSVPVHEASKRAEAKGLTMDASILNNPVRPKPAATYTRTGAIALPSPGPRGGSVGIEPNPSPVGNVGIAPLPSPGPMETVGFSPTPNPVQVDPSSPQGAELRPASAFQMGRAWSAYQA